MGESLQMSRVASKAMKKQLLVDVIQTRNISIGGLTYINATRMEIAYVVVAKIPSWCIVSAYNENRQYAFSFLSFKSKHDDCLFNTICTASEQSTYDVLEPAAAADAVPAILLHVVGIVTTRLCSRRALHSGLGLDYIQQYNRTLSQWWQRASWHLMPQKG